MVKIVRASEAVVLSDCEIEILEMMSMGKTNAQIAIALGYSYQNIKKKVSSICAKIGADNRTHAVAIAVSQGIVSEGINGVQ